MSQKTTNSETAVQETESPEQEVTVATETSAKRKFAAVATGTAVTALLSVGANLLIERLSKKVQNLIAPEQK